MFGGTIVSANPFTFENIDFKFQYGHMIPIYGKSQCSTESRGFSFKKQELDHLLCL